MKRTGKLARYLGLLLFLWILWVQSLFVSEIRVYGYRTVPEQEILCCLKEAGVYPGCRIRFDDKAAKLAVYDAIPQVSWVGMKREGCLLEVTVVEKKPEPAALPPEQPVDLVADKAGYLETISVENGKGMAAVGDYVSRGAVLISGTVPLSPTAYGYTSASAMYVHAAGEIQARIPVWAVLHQERYELLLPTTGRSAYAVFLSAGNRSLRIALPAEKSFQTAVKNTELIFQTIRPIPVSIVLVRLQEAVPLLRERSEAELSAEALRFLADSLPESAVIVNNSLNFTASDNIIETEALLETLQQIGKEQEIEFGENRQYAN